MDKLDRLIKVNHHLGIALAELGKIAGSGAVYVGSLREFRKLVSVKIKLERILNETRSGELIGIRVRRRKNE